MLKGKDGKSSMGVQYDDKAVNNDDLKSPGVLSENYDQEIKDVVTEEYHNLRLSLDRDEEYEESNNHKQPYMMNTTTFEQSINDGNNQTRIAAQHTSNYPHEIQPTTTTQPTFFNVTSTTHRFKPTMVHSQMSKDKQPNIIGKSNSFGVISSHPKLSQAKFTNSKNRKVLQDQGTQRSSKEIQIDLIDPELAVNPQQKKFNSNGLEIYITSFNQNSVDDLQKQQHYFNEIDRFQSYSIVPLTIQAQQLGSKSASPKQKVHCITNQHMHNFDQRTYKQFPAPQRFNKNSKSKSSSITQLGPSNSRESLGKEQDQHIQKPIYNQEQIFHQQQQQQQLAQKKSQVELDFIHETNSIDSEEEYSKLYTGKQQSTENLIRGTNTNISPNSPGFSSMISKNKEGQRTFLLPPIRQITTMHNGINHMYSMAQESPFGGQDSQLRNQDEAFHGQIQQIQEVDIKSDHQVQGGQETTDDDLDALSPRQGQFGGKKQQKKARNNSFQTNEIKKQEKLVKMDSKQLLDILKDLNHVTDMEEMNAAFNLIRFNITQISDNKDLQVQFLKTLKEFILKQPDPISTEIKKILESSGHQAPISHTLKLLNYTNYIKKTSCRAGQFQHLVNESKFPGVKGGRMGRMYYHNEDISNRQMQNINIKSTYVDGHLRLKGYKNDQASSEEDGTHSQEEQSTLNIEIDKDMLLYRQLNVSRILKDRGRSMGHHFLIPQKETPILMQINESGTQPDNGYQDIEKQLLINKEVEQQMARRHAGPRDNQIRKRVHMNFSDIGFTHDEMDKQRTQSKVSNWSIKDARNDQLKPAYIDEEDTQQSNSSRENFSNTASNKKRKSKTKFTKTGQRFDPNIKMSKHNMKISPNRQLSSKNITIKQGQIDQIEDKMGKMTLNISPRIQSSLISKSKKESNNKKQSNQGQSQLLNIHNKKQHVDHHIAQGTRSFRQRYSKIIGTNSVAPNAIQVKPITQNLNRYFKEAHIGLTGEKVMKYYSKQVDHVVFEEKIKNPGLMNALTGLTDQLKEEVIQQPVSPERISTSQHRKVIDKLQESGDVHRLDSCRLSRTTLEFAATQRAEFGRSGVETRSPRANSYRKKIQKEMKSTLNTSIINMNQMVGRIPSPDLKNHGQDGKLQEHLRTFKHLKLNRQLSPHNVNFTLTNYGGNESVTKKISQFEVSQRLQQNESKISATHQDLSHISQTDNKRNKMLSTMQNSDAKKLNNLNRNADVKEITEQRVKSYNSRLSTPPTSKSDSNMIIPQMLDHPGVVNSINNQRKNHQNNLYQDEQSSTKERTNEDFEETIKESFKLQKQVSYYMSKQDSNNPIDQKQKKHPFISSSTGLERNVIFKHNHQKNPKNIYLAKRDTQQLQPEETLYQGIFSTINESTVENSTTFASQSRYNNNNTQESGKNLRKKRYTTIAPNLFQTNFHVNSPILHIVDSPDIDTLNTFNTFTQRHNSLLPSLTSPIHRVELVQRHQHFSPPPPQLNQSGGSPSVSGAPSSSIPDINTVKQMKAHKNRMNRIRDKKSLSFLGNEQIQSREQLAINYQKLREQLDVIKSIKEQKRAKGLVGSIDQFNL